MTTFNAASSPYARAVPAGPAAGEAPAPPAEAPAAAPAATAGGAGGEADSPVPTPQRHLRLVTDETAGRTEDAEPETPQSPPASGESGGESAAAAPEETGSGPDVAGWLATVFVPPLRELCRARRPSLTDLITYHDTAPYTTKEGFARKVSIGFNRAWSVPYNANLNLLGWAFGERISRTLFFAALAGSTWATIHAMELSAWIVIWFGLVWWVSIAVVAFVIGRPGNESE